MSVDLRYDEPLGGRMKGSCVIVHGLAEHSYRYIPLQEYLAEHGYASYAFDLRGHGEAAGWPGKVSGPDEWLDDLAEALGEVPRDPPVFVVAHSMGTLVALATLAERGQEGVGGIVLSGTAVTPGQAVIESLADPEAPGIPAEHLSHDATVVEAYEEDPLVFNSDVPAECTAAVMLCSQRAFEGAPSVTVPALLLHGGADAICDPQGARDVLEALGSEDKTLKVYDGLYHEIFNETRRERAKVLKDMLGWLDKRV